MYDVWENKTGTEISVDGNGTRKVNVAIYCRVSTEHEAQVKALDNQIDWFNSQLSFHPNWHLVNHHFSAKSKRNSSSDSLREINGFYIDEGLSGLKTTTRPAFNKLIDDAKSGKIDLIITREVCRFSRNVVDAVSISRELKRREYGVGIYFVNDNIFSCEPNNEFYLPLFATFAQNESMKISERVRAGQKTSRNNNVLYGNGNILGYDRIQINGKNAYIINETQAKTVQRIFELYEEGNGTLKIINTLTKEGHKNSSGENKWSYYTILRILRNKTYCGYVSYNVTKLDGCLEKKRHNINNSEREFKKVSPDIVPPIIDEETWDRCQKMLIKNRKEYFNSKTATGKSTSAKDVFAKKLRCNCGHSFRRDLWYKGKTGNNYGYSCYNVLKFGKSYNYTDQNDIEKLNICNMPGISERKLKIQANRVFSEFFNDVSLVDDIIKAKTKSANKAKSKIKSIKASKTAEIEKMEKRITTLTNKLADGILTDEAYMSSYNEASKRISQLKKELEEKDLELNNIPAPDIDIAQIRNALTQVINFDMDVDTLIIDKFVYRIIVDSPTHFIWQLHFKPINEDNPTFANISSYHIDASYAKDYAKKHNKLFRQNQWEDIDVDVQIAI